MCHYLSQLQGIRTGDFPRLPYKDITRIVDSLITLASRYSRLSTLIKIILQTTPNPLPGNFWAQRRERKKERKKVLTHRRNVDGRVSHGGGEIVHVGVVAAVVGGVDPSHPAPPAVAGLVPQVAPATQHLSRGADAEKK